MDSLHRKPKETQSVFRKNSLLGGCIGLGPKPLEPQAIGLHECSIGFLTYICLWNDRAYRGFSQTGL